MSNDTVKTIYKIAKEYDANKVVVLTNHLKFVGTLCDCEDAKKDDDILTLQNVMMWRLKDICNCKEPGCECNDSNFCSLEWLHINVSKIVAFSLQK